MKTEILMIFIYVLMTAGVNCDIPLEIRKEVFNIFKGIVVEVKEKTDINVTLDKVKFTLFNKNYVDDGIVITSGNIGLVQPTRDKIIFIIHGWISSANEKWVFDMKKAFLSISPESSVISVNWENAANKLYSVSALNTYHVGTFIADKIIDLIDNHNVSINKFLLVGHSLGGHACGFAGKKIKSVGKKLPRIVGLDPAGPLFAKLPFNKRLNSDDADVVDVIHTDVDVFGFRISCGTIDFFPNGGHSQPGCERIDLQDFPTSIESVMCAHQISYHYFTEAILNPTTFVCTYCTKYGILRRCDENIKVSMGDLTTRLTGIFYLQTNEQPPDGEKKTNL